MTLKTPNAFVLAELLVVLVLMAILVSGSIVAFRNRQDEYALTMAAKDLASAMQFAAETSQRTGGSLRIRFDDAHTAYRLEEKVGTSQFDPLPGQAGVMHPLPQGVQVAEILIEDLLQTPLPEWLAFGSNDESFAGKVRLTGSDGMWKVIEVMAETGQVHVVSE